MTTARVSAPVQASGSALSGDITRMWRYCHAHGLAARLTALHRPRPWISLTYAGLDWAVIFASFALVRACGLSAFPLALLIIGNRQRALGNLMHDAAHGSLIGVGTGADRLTRWLLFYPLCNSITRYRREHFAHHRSLGIAGADGDLLHDEADMNRPWHKLLWRHVASRQNFGGSLLAHLPRAAPAERLAMLFVWTVLLGAIFALAGSRAALEFLLLWLAARASAFHVITMFREISDHVGLQPGTLMGFSRNQIGGLPLRALFHPHHNGYHLLHHLAPGLPFHALPRAHRLLLAWPEYASAGHYRGYFSGAAPLVKSWVRG